MSFIKHLIPAWKTKLEGNETNAVILSAIEEGLKETELDTIEGKIQMGLDTANGKWLDRFGSLFGPTRKENEKDNSYRERIVEYVTIERGTIPAIKEALYKFLNHEGTRIVVYEPHTNIFYLNKSKLNGEDHLLGYYYTYAVINIKISTPFPETIRDIIYDFKPAGVRVYLTYIPNGHNANPDYIELPLANSIVKRTNSRLTIMNGMNRRIRGHLNLTAHSNRKDDSGLFFTNRSKLNSKDRLAGSLSASQSTFNLVTYSDADVAFSHNTEMGDVSELTEGNKDSVSQDFYTKTGTINEEYAELNIQGDKETYLYLTLDVGTYLDLQFPDELKRAEPSGVYTKKTFKKLIDKPYIHQKTKSQLSRGEHTLIHTQVYNLDKNTWHTIETTKSTQDYKTTITDIGDIRDFLSEKGIVFTRLKIEPLEQTNGYRLRLGFYELGFQKMVKIEPTIDLGVQRISTETNVGALIDGSAILDSTHEVDTSKELSNNDSIAKLKNNILGTDFYEGQ